MTKNKGKKTEKWKVNYRRENQLTDKWKEKYVELFGRISLSDSYNLISLHEHYLIVFRESLHWLIGIFLIYTFVDINCHNTSFTYINNRHFYYTNGEKKSFAFFYSTSPRDVFSLFHRKRYDIYYVKNILRGQFATWNFNLIFNSFINWRNEIRVEFRRGGVISWGKRRVHLIEPMTCAVRNENFAREKRVGEFISWVQYIWIGDSFVSAEADRSTLQKQRNWKSPLG